MLLGSSRYEELNQEVVDLLEAYRVTAFPLDIFNLAERMGIRLIPYSSISRVKRSAFDSISEDAFTLSQGRYEVGTTFICFNQDANERRLRHSIAHEIGHIWLEHANSDEPCETEAEYFAAYLLAPIPVIINRQLRTVLEVQNYFNVSYEAARIALERSGNRLRCRKPQFDYEYKLIEMCTSKGGGHLESA